MYGKSLRDAEQAVSMAPQSEEAYSRKGDALYRLGRFDVALGAYEIALVLSDFHLADVDGIVARYQECLSQTVANFQQAVGAKRTVFKESLEWKRTDGGRAFFGRGSGKILSLALLNPNPKVAFLACDVILSLRKEHPEYARVLPEVSASGGLSRLLDLILHPPRDFFKFPDDNIIWNDQLVSAAAELSSSSHIGDELVKL
jgi:tetratricopeptide (TPR) repeat protein